MYIEGLDYNTERNKLLMPEYGREIQHMVEYCKSIPDRVERQKCAETIVEVMSVMNPQTTDTQSYQQKLWDHLAIISNFELDIDYPVEITKKEDFYSHPDPLEYPMQRIRQRHYGHLLEELFEKLKTYPTGEERDELVRLAANQMKRSLFVWNRGSADDEKVADDLARFTDGVIQLDLDDFTFARIEDRPSDANKSQKKKKK